MIRQKCLLNVCYSQALLYRKVFWGPKDRYVEASDINSPL